MRPRLALLALLVLCAAAGAWWWLGRPERVVGMAASRPSERPRDVEPTPSRSLARASPVDAGPATTPAAPRVIASFGWGRGPGQLGRRAPSEGNPEAPMSLASEGGGALVVVDQVNGRLLKVDRSGKPAGEVPVPVQAAQDVAVARDGTVVVMDRLVDKAIGLIGPDGRPRGELRLAGKGFAEPGGATGVFVDGSDVYVEREHGDLVKLGTTDGVSDAQRPEVPGRPSRDGRAFMTASLGDRQAGTVWLTVIDRPGLAHRFTRAVPVAAPLVAVNLLDSDERGVIYVGALVELAASTPEAPRFGIELACVDPLDGHVLGRARTDANTEPGETFRELVVLDEGGVVFLRRTEQGAELERLTCR